MPCRKLVSQTLVRISACSSLASLSGLPTHRAFPLPRLSARAKKRTRNLAYAAVGVFEAYYVFLVELSEGNLQDAYRFIPYRR